MDGQGKSICPLTLRHGDITITWLMKVQWHLSTPTYQGTREMCRIVQDVGILRFHLGSRQTFTVIINQNDFPLYFTGKVHLNFIVSMSRTPTILFNEVQMYFTCKIKWEIILVYNNSKCLSRSKMSSTRWTSQLYGKVFCWLWNLSKIVENAKN
jgi:hypothetical protein